MLTPQSDIEIFGSAAVDALTLTSKSVVGRAMILSSFEEFMFKNVSLQKERKRATILGCTGYKAGNIFWGGGKYFSMLTAKGEYSMEYLRMLVKDFGILDDVDSWGEVKPTRVDICVDMALEEPYPKMLRDIRKDKRVEEIQLEAKRAFNLIDGLSGDTLYFGKRGSPTFARIYDKSESYGMGLGSVYRFELETKKRVAKPMFRKLMSGITDVTKLEDGLRGPISKIIRGQFLKYGIDLNTKDQTAEYIRGEVGLSTVDVKLDWLSRSVAPVLGELRARGYEQAAFQALGVVGQGF